MRRNMTSYAGFRQILAIFLAIVVAMIIISFTASLTVSFIIASIVLGTLILRRSVGLIWTLLLGILMETISPFPPLAYLAATLLTFGFLRILIINAVSRYTIFGVVASGLSAVLIFEVSIYLFALLGSAVASGWIPVLTRAYLTFVAIRMISTALVVTVIFTGIRRFSPWLRGIAIRRA